MKANRAGENRAALYADLLPGAAEYLRNAVRRCDALPGEACDDCRARMRGEAKMVEGSVEEGVYRERREIVPAPDPAPQPAKPGTAH